MATMIAKLIRFDLIEVTIQNSYYNGETTTLTLKKGRDLIALSIQRMERLESETRYQASLQENFEFGLEYEVLDDHGLRTPLVIDSVVRTKEFDDLFFYEGDLGNNYTKDRTCFSIWTPIATQVKLEIQKDASMTTTEMKRNKKGVWELTVVGDCEGATYVYLLKINGAWQEAIDPYAYSSTLNHRRSVVIDLEKTKLPLNRECLPPFESFTDAVIYEMHVRDFSVNLNSQIKNKGKFLGVVEGGTKTKLGNPTGFDYVKTLGVTHLQLLPVYDFGSVDEDNQMKYYNWGYDPVQYNVPEGSYAVDLNNPYSRVIELKQMIASLHEVGLRVNMDVVYNHMFDQFSSSFHHIIPGYYFRYGRNNEVSNGSFCGNDIASDRLMVRRFIIESCLRWIEFYGFDGFRFDLMGIIDQETMNQLRNELNKIDPSIMLYGEGWNMPTLLPDELKSSMQNYQALQNIGHFNDYYRNLFKGPHHDLSEVGFALGNLDKTEEGMFSLLGTAVPLGSIEKPYLGSPEISINYSECHDNYTLFDQLTLVMKDKSEAEIKEKHRFITSLMFIAQGIPFIHGGQEFLRSKQGVENSYLSPDHINWFDWDRKDEHFDQVEYIKGLIEIRKSFKGFRLNTPEAIKEAVTIQALEPGVIDYRISYEDEVYQIYINATDDVNKIVLDTTYHLLVNKYEANIHSIANVEEIEVEPSSLVVLKKK
jgi:pullulanase